MKWGKIKQGRGTGCAGDHAISSEVLQEGLDEKRTFQHRTRTHVIINSVWLQVSAIEQPTKGCWGGQAPSLAGACSSRHLIGMRTWG